MTVAEIGSGWGAFAIHIAATTGARVTAINVSPEQLRVARENAVAAGVDGLVEFRELDYRALEGRFDRVVSVGMMEHVGIGHFDAYFGKIRGLLADDGFAFVHCIGRMRPPGSTGPFIRKYIFPGAYVPSLSEVFAATERAGLWVADMEVLRLHYHYTLQHWRRRFAANRARAAELYDERFCRMWEYYLAAVDVGFSNGGNMVFQLLLSAKIDAVPILRDYSVDDLRAASIGTFGQRARRRRFFQSVNHELKQTWVRSAIFRRQDQSSAYPASVSRPCWNNWRWAGGIVRARAVGCAHETFWNHTSWRED